MKIEYSRFFVGFVFDKDTIVMHPDLLYTEWHKLRLAIVEHELGHDPTSLISVHDVTHDLVDMSGPELSWLLTKFVFLHPSTWFNFLSPISYYKRTWFYDVTHLVIYSFFVVIGIIIYVIMHRGV
jgi:hypothetical protein